MIDKIPEIVKDLAAAVSNAARIQNRYWMALLAVSLFVLIPRPPVANDPVKVSLPFDLGTVEPSWFLAASTLMLSVLLIVFCAAQVHLVRVLEFMHEILRERRRNGLATSKIDERDLISALQLPSLSRVAPLAQVLKGKYRFFHNKAGCPKWRLLVSGLAYVLWKLLSFGVWLALPGWALFSAWSGYRTASPPETAAAIWPYLPFVIWPVAIGAASALLIAFYLEARYVVVALANIAQRKEAS